MIPGLETPSPLPTEAGQDPIVGWRTWFVLPHEGVLRPIYMRGLAWKPGQAVEAVCPETLHVAPEDGCRCGVWAVCHPMLLSETHWRIAPPDDRDPLPGILVVGQIAMWGRVIQHERGWRSSHAYPKHLYVFSPDEAIAAALRDRYHVPVTWGADAEALKRFLPPVTPATSAAIAAPAPGSPQARAEVFVGLLNLLPSSVPFKTVARDQFERWQFRIGYADDRALRREREALLRLRERLANAIARGGYYTSRYGDDWRATIRYQIRSQWRDLVVEKAMVNALAGNATAARRLLYLWLGGRWREAYDTWIEAANLQDRMKSKRNRITKKRLAASTIEQRKQRLEYLRRELNAQLQALADVPTPSYREWRQVTGG